MRETAEMLFLLAGGVYDGIRFLREIVDRNQSPFLLSMGSAAGGGSPYMYICIY